MNARNRWSRILVVVGGIAMLLGAIDPLEGSMVVVVGSALVLLGMLLGQEERRARLFWAVTFVLVAVGVAAMFALSAVGGIGGTSGRSMWWVVLILPYPVGWIMGMANLLLRVIGIARHRHAAA
jgi:hypothetical protein